MHFELSDDQKMIRDTVRTFVRKELPVERMRKLRSDSLGYSKAIWQQMGELGWLGIMFPEELGGFGGNFVDAALIVEEFGSTLVSEPYIASVILAGKTLEFAGDEAQKQRWLAPMLAGETTLALAYAEKDNRFSLQADACIAIPQANGHYKIRGEKRWVLNGHAADHIVVSAKTPEGTSLFLLDGEDPDLGRRSVASMDGRRAAMLSFDCIVPANRRLGADGTALPVLENVIDLAAAAACAEGYGIMKTVLAMTLDYLKTREQFGAKVGTFQALQHRAVDMFIETELAKSTAIMAAIKADDSDTEERQRAISAAKAQMAVGGKFVTQQAIQLHGGIGVTDEHDIGLYFKRMHALNTLFGDESYHVARYMKLPSFEKIA